MLLHGSAAQALLLDTLTLISSQKKQKQQQLNSKPEHNR